MLHWTFCYRNTTTSLCIRWSQFFCPKKIHVIGEVERQFPKERATAIPDRRSAAGQTERRWPMHLEVCLPFIGLSLREGKNHLFNSNWSSFHCRKLGIAHHGWKLGIAHNFYGKINFELTKIWDNYLDSEVGGRWRLIKQIGVTDSRSQNS